MGKKQHSKDQLYLTQTEWAHEWGGAKINRHLPHKVRTQQCKLQCPCFSIVLGSGEIGCLSFANTEHRSSLPRALHGVTRIHMVLRAQVLPFDCCAISFRPIEGTPMATKEGHMFDLLNIVPYLKKYRRHPVTGGALAASDLFKLLLHRNSEGKFHCPVLFKVFNQHTHIVAIRATGNVFCYEAIKELNIKTNNMADLLENIPFTKDDLVTLQVIRTGIRRFLVGNLDRP